MNTADVGKVADEMERRHQLSVQEELQVKFKDEKERDEWLAKYDKDASNTFDRPEFLQLVVDLGAELHAVTIDPRSVPKSLLDKTFAGKEALNADEVYAAVKRVLHWVQARGKLEALFQECDADNNGVLNKDELTTLLQKGAPKDYTVTKDDVAFVLQKCDQNADEKISLDELGPAVATWMQMCKTISEQQKEKAKKKSSACAIL